MSGWHIRDKLWPMRKVGSFWLFYVHRNHKAQDGHLDLHTAPELWLRASAEPSVPPVKTEYHHVVVRRNVYEERGGAYRAESVCGTLCTTSQNRVLPHCAQIESLWRKRRGLQSWERLRNPLYHQSKQSTTTLCPDGKFMKKEAGLTELRASAKHYATGQKRVQARGGQTESLWRKRRASELSTEPSVHPRLCHF